MDLEFTSEQEALRDGVRALLENECAPAVLRALVERGEAPTGLWKQQVELGFPALALPEELGGLGLGAVELLVLAEETGRFAAPGPWLATATQFAPIVFEAATDEQRGRFLSPVAEGTLTGALAIAETATGAVPETVRSVARRTADGWRLSGEKFAVVDGGTADEIAVVAAIDEPSDRRLGVFVVPRSDLDVQQVDTLDATRPWASLQLSDVRVEDERALGTPGESYDAIKRGLETATMCIAAEIVGVCSRLFEMTLDYAKVREQFGKPIGTFQAIKHKLADCYVELERARACVYFAAATLAEDDTRRSVAVAMAKAAASDCSVRLVQEALQTHGGIGYTWEHDLQFFLMRAKADAVLLGSAATHRARVAAEIGLAG